MGAQSDQIWPGSLLRSWFKSTEEMSQLILFFCFFLGHRSLKTSQRSLGRSVVIVQTTDPEG